MTDREKVIRDLETYRDRDFIREGKTVFDSDPRYRKMIINNALAILKAQDPVKPNLDVDEWMCGNCGHKLEHQELLGDNMLFHEQYNYCPNCGRKVKWE